MREYSIEEPFVWESTFETVMAAYDKRMATVASRIEHLLDVKVVSAVTSRNGAFTVVWICSLYTHLSRNAGTHVHT